MFNLIENKKNEWKMIMEAVKESPDFNEWWDEMINSKALHKLCFRDICAQFYAAGILSYQGEGDDE